MRRGVAQFGSALGLGPRGRGFESLNPDHVGAGCISFSLIFLKVRVRLLLIFAKKARSARLFACRHALGRLAVAAIFLRVCFLHKYLFDFSFVAARFANKAQKGGNARQKLAENTAKTSV